MLAATGIAVFVVLVGALFALVLWGPRSPQAPVQAASGAATGAPEIDFRKEAEAHWAKVMAGEWTAYRGAPGIEGVSVHDGWVRFVPSADQLRSAYEQGIPVYDVPDGKVVGYDYGSLGYVPVEVATAPGFDVRKARINKFGCDPQDPACQAKLRGSR